MKKWNDCPNWMLTGSYTCLIWEGRVFVNWKMINCSVRDRS